MRNEKPFRRLRKAAEFKARAMNEESEFVMAMAALAFAAAILVAGLLYMQKTSMQLPPTLAPHETSSEAGLP
jgi:hypothetical protein